MDVRADTRDDDDLLAAIMLNVQRTLSFAPDKILCGDLSTNLSIVQFMGSSVSRHRRWSGKAIRAHILAELCTLLVNLRKLSANSEKLEEYIVGLGKKIVLEKNTELMSPEVSAEVVREPSIAENESFASVEGPLAKGNEAQKSASEAFWVPYSDNDTKPAEEEKSAKKKKRSRSLH
ncbi:hypothetical protein RB195_011488 [Necator americanus]|uniref:Uncharacterized protein n=1 Tax=Necator americanus TaxID=51031 RepID=A0ABR1D2S3_NECAM